MKKVAILQSNYIPWKGYFDMIASVDEFIIFDDMQYTRRDWRNRNMIKTPQGTSWLTVPVRAKGNYFQKIRDIEIDGTAWARDHWNALTHNYRRAPYFKEIAEWLEPVYVRDSFTHLHQLNVCLIQAVCNFLGIETTLSRSWDYQVVDGKTERLADLCRQAQADEYISGPAAKDYIDPDVFRDYGIKLTWFEYSGYPEYPQLWGGFIHHVSVLDLLFNCGPDAHKSMRFVQA